MQVLLPDGHSSEILEVPIECTAAQLVHKLRAKGSLTAADSHSSAGPAAATAAADGDDQHARDHGDPAGRANKRVDYGTRSWADIARA